MDDKYINLMWDMVTLLSNFEREIIETVTKKKPFVIKYDSSYYEHIDSLLKRSSDFQKEYALYKDQSFRSHILGLKKHGYTLEQITKFYDKINF